MTEKLTRVACIPAFKEEATIAKVVLSARKYVDQVFVCDDGSPDMTGEIAEELGAIVIKHEKNMGKGSAVKSLLNEAYKCKADVVVLLDADGQHDPSEIEMLAKPIEHGEADLVVGSRYLGKGNEIPLKRKIGLKVVDFLLGATNVTRVNDTQCGYRAFSRKALEVISAFDAEGYGVESEVLALAAKNGLKVVEIPVNVRYAGLNNTSKRLFLRHGGELMSTVLRLVVEERPLLLLGVPGILLLIIGLASVLDLILVFNSTRIFNIPIALISFGATISGLVLTVASLILYVLCRLRVRR